MKSIYFRSSLLFGSVLLGVSVCWAQPSQVLIIRHAEKPANDKDPHLSARGQERARALVGFFTTDPTVTQFGFPVAIYAGAPKHSDGSLRSIETVTPLANSLAMEINARFKSDEVSGLVDEILNDRQYEGKSVLVAWSHDEIPKMAFLFGAQSAPTRWSGKVFDRVWKITFTQKQSPKFEDLPQNILKEFE